MKDHITPYGAFGLVLLVWLAGCASRPSTFRLYPPDALSTTASPAVVAQAISDMHEALGRQAQAKPGGSRGDLSFSQKSRWWGAEKTPGNTAVDLTRSTTEFRDARGRLVSLEIIRDAGAPAVVFFSYEDTNGAMPAINAFVTSLQRQGVKHAK
jgi:hypothetical protein